MKLLYFIITLIYACSEDPRTSELRVVVNEFTRIEDVQVPSPEANRTRMLRAIYSTILDSTGALGGGFASRFYWHGDELHLFLERNVETVDGWRVGIDDVIFSLKIYLSHDRYSDHASAICGVKTLKSPDASCPGIHKKTSKELVLKYHSKPKRDLLRWLADVFVVPRNAVDKNWRIVDHRNTSGPYRFLKRQSTEKRLVFVRNKAHWHLHPHGPKSIVFIPFPLFKGMIKHDVDMSWWLPEQLHKNSTGTLYCQHTTRLEMLRFSDEGMQLPVDQRQDFVRHVKKIYPGLPTSLSNEDDDRYYGYRTEVEMLQQLSYGGGMLSPDQLEAYHVELKRSPGYQLSDLNLSDITPYRKALTVLNIPYEYIPINNASIHTFSRPGMTLNVTHLDGDPFANDENLKAALFGTPIWPPFLAVRGKDAENWWNTYQSLENREDKLKMIRQLHYDSLIGNPSVVPVMQERYCYFVSFRWDVGDYLNWRVHSYAHYQRKK